MSPHSIDLPEALRQKLTGFANSQGLTYRELVIKILAGVAAIAERPPGPPAHLREDIARLQAKTEQ
jgi:hypothetical protein